MNHELDVLRAELVRLRQERDRLESEANLWRTRYFELVAQSLRVREERPLQDHDAFKSQLPAEGLNSSRCLAIGKGAIVA